MYPNPAKRSEKNCLSLLSAKQQQELKQFILDVDGGKIRIAELLTCPFGSHVVCCMNRNAGKAKFEIEKEDLFFSLEQSLVRSRNKVIELTAKEFDILALLIRNPKRVFTYEMITELVWNKEYASFSRKAVSNHVSNLRQKIKVSPDVPDYIKSVCGVGYKFEIKEISVLVAFLPEILFYLHICKISVIFLNSTIRRRILEKGLDRDRKLSETERRGYL